MWSQHCYSRVLKKNIGGKWVKYIINKNIKNRRRSCYNLQQNLTHQQKPPKHFEQHIFLYEICGFYHIHGYFWTLTASSLSLSRFKKVFLLLEVIIFRFYTLFQFFFYSIFLLNKKFLSFYRNVGRSTLVGQRPMKSLRSVCLSVCPSIRPSLSSLKIVSLIFSDIVHDDSWPWYLVVDTARFLKKKIGVPNLGQMGQIRTQNYFFCYFLKFGSLVLLDIAYNDSLQQCLTCSRGRI